MWAVAIVAALLVAGTAHGAGPCASTGQTPYDYKEALCMSILFYEAQRSGPLPSDMRFDWRGDSALSDGSDHGLDLTGGYYDAGDHVKFGFPMSYSLTVLAWSLLSFGPGYDAAGQADYARAAIRWGTDYFLKAHSASNTFYGQVGDGYSDHSYWGRPEDMTMTRPSWSLTTSAPGSDLAGETAAALAAASLVFQNVDSAYAAQCLAAARDLFDFADGYRATYDTSITAAADFYKSWSGYGDELGYAAAWMYKATGESVYETKARGFWTEFNLGLGTDRFDWDNKYAGAFVLFSEQFGDSTYTSALSTFMNNVRSRQQTPGGMVYIDQWGSLRHAINVAFIGFQAANLGIDTSANQAFAAQQVNYALGSVGHSYMVGFGNNPPTQPHHRSSSCPDPPTSCTDGWAQNQDGPNPQVLYGAMVGGPDSNDGYVDDRNDYVHNEVACDYNAALTGALAAMVTLNA